MTYKESEDKNMLERQDLLTLEEYAEKRSEIRKDTIQIKKLRDEKYNKCINEGTTESNCN